MHVRRDRTHSFKLDQNRGGLRPLRFSPGRRSEGCDSAIRGTFPTVMKTAEAEIKQQIWKPEDDFEVSQYCDEGLRGLSTQKVHALLCGLIEISQRDFRLKVLNQCFSFRLRQRRQGSVKVRVSRAQIRELTLLN